MNFSSNRFNNYHIIDKSGPEKWSNDWKQFPGLPFAFSFEDNFRFICDDIQEFLINKWHYSVYISIIYIIIILSLKEWMKTRTPFNLRNAQILWSFFMALYSIVATIRYMPETINVIINDGLYYSICNASFYRDVRILFWSVSFAVSKVVELGDTIFIVLRKKQLIQLHWIHHALTLCFVWFSTSEYPAIGRWMGVMNVFIHSFMYTYYTLTAMGVKIPKFISLMITTMQIIQMIFGLFINITCVYYKYTDVKCDISPSVAITGSMLYILFFLLFVNFFINRYFKKQINDKYPKNNNSDKKFD